MNRKILYIQYTNPACYPSLEHSSRILANLGWKVLFLGAGCFGKANEIHFAPHVNITVHQLPFCKKGLLQKLQYIWFCAWAIFWVLRWRPNWVYASDPLSCPGVLIISYFPGVKIIYHEHDSPNLEHDGESYISSFMKFVLWTRRRLALRIPLCILPNEERKEKFKLDIGKDVKVFRVWNCPRRETADFYLSKQKDRNTLSIVYGGSIAPDRLPISILYALSILPNVVTLRIIGYETIGSLGYIRRLKEISTKVGISNRIEFLEAMPRYQLLQLFKECDIGLALIAKNTDNLNLRYMVGASQKTFDYMACGLTILVSDLQDWKKMYVEPGYGLACNPEDPENIAISIRWFLEHPDEMRQMGDRNRQKILQDWNYETQFAPVMNLLFAE